MTLTQTHVRAWLVELANVYATHKQQLTDLDSPIGDADHGNNMSRGFKAVATMVETSDDDLGPLLKATAMTLLKTVGGASGPLYGTLFLKMSQAANPKTELTAAEFLETLRQGVEGVMKKGRAEKGDKTMIDAWLPALDALQASVDRKDPIGVGLQAAADAAKSGMEGTVPMQARKGRASYLGERSIGHQDPGATSTYLMLDALAQVVN